MWFVDIPPHPNPLPPWGEGVSLIPLLCKEGRRGGRGNDQDGALVLHRRLALPHLASPYKGEEMTQEGARRAVPLLQNSVNE